MLARKSSHHHDDGIYIATKIKNKPWSTFTRFCEVLSFATNFKSNLLFTNPSTSTTLVQWYENLRKAHTAVNNFKFPTESGSMKKMDLPKKSKASPDNRIIARIFLDFINMHMREIEKDLTEEMEQRVKNSSNTDKQCECMDFGGNYTESDPEDEDLTQEELFEDYQHTSGSESERKLEKKRKLASVSSVYERKLENIKKMALETRAKLAKIEESASKDSFGPKQVMNQTKLDGNAPIELAVKQAKLLRHKFIENLQQDEKELAIDFPKSTPYLNQIKDIYEHHSKQVKQLSQDLIAEKNQFLTKLEEEKSKYLEEWKKRFNEQQKKGVSEEYLSLKSMYETADKVHSKKKEIMEERYKQMEKVDDEILQKMLE